MSSAPLTVSVVPVPNAAAPVRVKPSEVAAARPELLLFVVTTLNALLILIPEVLALNVPPLNTNLPTPNALLFPTLKVPAFKNALSVFAVPKVFDPLRTRVPAPFLIKLLLPEMTPPSLKFIPAPTEKLPPPKTTARLTVELLLAVICPPFNLIIVPVVSANVPVPKLKFKVPLSTVIREFVLL